VNAVEIQGFIYFATDRNSLLVGATAVKKPYCAHGSTLVGAVALNDQWGY